MDQHKDRMNIVAAPGSGKTTLGLEIMRRIGKPSIILVPNITIRNQWVERLVSMFMSEQEPFPDWISKDIRKPKFLTVTTYQALHAIFSGIEEKDDGEIQEEDKIRNKTTIAKIAKRKADEKTKVIALLKKQKISTIILDESHHLRKEWWKALADLRVGIKKVFIISLTATPPYDVDANEWDKYEELCGPIDIEISVPELVSSGDLCPHQDYIRFSLLTRQESEKISQFKEEVNNTLSALRGSPDFLKIILMHPWINDTENHMEFIFKDPKFFSAILIFLNSVGQKIPYPILNILGVKQTDLPELNLTWFETLLNIVVHIHTFEQRQDKSLEFVSPRLDKQLLSHFA
jgi:superfamily II DNA or RNA helicase